MKIILDQVNRKKIKLNKPLGSKKLSFIIMLLTILVMPIFIICLIIIVKTLLYPNKIPDVFGYKTLIELTNTMEDNISYGDLAFLKVVDVDTLKEGDIIAFRNKDNTKIVTMHRISNIVEKSHNKFFVTKGDSAKQIDSIPVTEAYIEGVYIGKIANLGNICLLIHRPIVLIITISVILVVGIICIYIAAKIDKRELEKQKELNEKRY